MLFREAAQSLKNISFTESVTRTAVASVAICP
jgi:hypothetical protein